MNGENQEKSVPDTAPVTSEGPGKPELTIIEGDGEKPLSLADRIAMLQKEQASADKDTIDSTLYKVDKLNKEIIEAKGSINTLRGEIKEAALLAIQEVQNTHDNLLENNEFKFAVIKDLRKRIKASKTIEELKTSLKEAEVSYKIIEVSYGNIKMSTALDNKEIQKKIGNMNNAFLDKLGYLRQKDIKELIEEIKGTKNVRALSKCIEKGVKKGFLTSDQFPNGNYKIFSTKCIPAKDDTKMTRKTLENLQNTIFTQYRSYKK